MSSNSTSRATWNKFLIIGSMYMGQTFATAFVTQLLPGIYRAQGLPLEKFWILSVGLIPFWFRWLWAPLVDRRTGGRYGRRKSWIIPCTIAGVASYALIAAVEPSIEAIWLVAGLFAIQAVAISTQEIAVDAYMVENLAPQERSTGSGVKLYMEAIAELIALAGLATIFDRYGWSWTLFAAAILFVVFFIPALIRKEPPLKLAKHSAKNPARPSLLRFLKRRDSWFIAGLLIAGGTGFGMYFPMTSAFLIDRGFTVGQTGVILGIIVVLGMLSGTTVAVKTLNRFGMKPTLKIVTIAALPSFVPALWLTQAGPLPAWATVACLVAPTMVISLIYVIFTVARLGWTSDLQAGTDYSIQSAIFRGAATAGIGVGGFLAAWFGWRGFFFAYALIVIAISLVFLGLTDYVTYLVSRRTEREHNSALPQQV